MTVPGNINGAVSALQIFDGIRNAFEGDRSGIVARGKGRLFGEVRRGRQFSRGSEESTQFSA
jgi:hypothetical protein